MGLIGDTCCEIKPIIEKDERPQAVKRQGLVSAVLECLDEPSGEDVVSVDMAVAEVSDKQDAVIELIETGIVRHSRQTPWEFSWPPVIKRLMNLPSVLKTSTKPLPGPGTSSCLSAS